MSHDPERAHRRGRTQSLRRMLDLATRDLAADGEVRERAVRNLLLVAGSAVALAEEMLDERRAPGAYDTLEASGRPVRG